MPIRETGYVHARSGAALALLRLGQRQHACQLADAELADVRVFGAPRSLGIALRTAGLARGGQEGLALLRESVAALVDSPALLERAHSLAELGAALRRDGQRAAARDPLARALDLAARCGARPLAARAREELKAAGARPRRPWRTGLGRADPQRAARRPAGRRGPLQPRDRLRAVRHPQGDRRSSGPRLRQARDRRPQPAGPRSGSRKRLGYRPYGEPPVARATV